MTYPAYKIVLFGPPASGKGTQADFLSEQLKLPEISTGELLREEVAKKTSIGQEIGDLLKQGALVSDDIVNLLLQKKINQLGPTSGFILDGYPRKVSQAVFLDKLVSVDFALEIYISDSEAISRISGRRLCSQCGESFHLKYNPPRLADVCDKCGGQLVRREDDHEDTIKNRLKLYHQQTEPLIKVYRSEDIYLKINGEQSINEVSQEILKKLKIK